MKDPRKDAKGVNAAVGMIAEGFDLVSTLDIRDICIAVINRYDQTKESAKMTEIAAGMFEAMISSTYGHFRISNLKKLCAYLTKGT